MKVGIDSKDKPVIPGRPTADAVRFYYVYILWCGDGKPYIGCIDDLKDRIKRHQSGYILATKNKLPIKLIAYFAFSIEKTARNFEKFLKSDSGRALIKRHNLIE